MAGQELFAAIRNRDQAAAAALLAEAPALAEARLENGVSLLLMAIYYGQPEIAAAIRQRRQTIDIWEATALGELAGVKAIVTDRPAAANAVAPDGFAPLGLAAFFGQLEVLGWLLAHGAEVDAPAQNEMRVRPIHSAAAHRDPATSLAMAERLLAHGAEVNVAQQGGWTPLHQAADHGHEALVKLLLAHGADKTALSDNELSAKAMAAAKGFDVVAALL